MTLDMAQYRASTDKAAKVRYARTTTTTVTRHLFLAKKKINFQFDFEATCGKLFRNFVDEKNTPFEKKQVYRLPERNQKKKETTTLDREKVGVVVGGVCLAMQINARLPKRASSSVALSPYSNAYPRFASNLI